MPIYAQLFAHTETGKREIDTIPTEVFPLARELVEELDGDVRELYYGNMGEYDGIAIVELPDETSVERWRLGLEREGTHHIESYRVFEAEEYFDMIEETTG
jgi:uncharacterized protein with GYD domain